MNSKEPFHICRNKIKNNSIIVEHVRLANGASVKAEGIQVQYATLITGIPTDAIIYMPMNGILDLTISPAATGTITVNNPYISNPDYPINVVSSGPIPSINITGPGQFTITMSSATSNVLVQVGPTN